MRKVRREVSIEVKQARKKRPDGLSHPKQNIVIFYKIWKKYNEIQLTKKNGT